MDEKKAVSCEELKIMLERLKTLDQNLQVFGADKHKYKSYPVSNEELKTLEGKLGVRLPEDYRHFLQVIGYGAGPYYGLASPDKLLMEINIYSELNEERFSAPHQPFPFTPEQAEECWRIMREHRAAAYFTEYPTDGCIPICFEGCTFWTYLVTAGDLAGSLWSHNQDVYSENEDGPYMDVWNLAPEPPSILGLHRDNFKPFVPVWEPALSSYPTFLEWYRTWIDRCLFDFEELKRESSDGHIVGPGKSGVGSDQPVTGSGKSVAGKNEFRILKSLVNLFHYKGKSK